MNAKDLDIIKGQKLLHYFKREPKQFIQYDGFVNTKPDDLMSPDDDGDCFFIGETVELMTGYTAVRLLIVPGTAAKDVIRVLGKIIDSIQKRPELLTIKTDMPDEESLCF